MGSKHSIFDRDQLNLQPLAARRRDLDLLRWMSFSDTPPGAVGYRAYPIFTRVVESLESGLLLSFGSAIMGPGVFLKALAMARTIAHRQGRSIRQFTNAFFRLSAAHRAALPALRAALIGRSVA